MQNKRIEKLKTNRIEISSVSLFSKLKNSIKCLYF